jgi:hypothetical protein
VTDFLGGIGDALGSAAGAVGDAAGATFDFLAPTTDRRGAGFSFSDLVNTAADVGRNSVLGGVSALDDVLRSDASWQQKLFVGGMVGAGIGGAAMGARALASQRKIERQFAQVNPQMMSRTSDQALGLGLSNRWAPGAPEEKAVMKQHPGIRSRSVPVMAAPDFELTTRALVSPAVADDAAKLAVSVSVVKTYADGLIDMGPEARLGGAQLDFAKVDTIIDNKMLRSVAADRKGKGAGYLNAELIDLWGKFKDAPDTLADEQKLRLIEFVRQIGDATDMISEPDLTFNVVDRVTGVFLTDQGAVLNIQSPVWDRLSTLMDPAVRSARLRDLNVRALADRGKEIFDRLLDMGLEDQRRRADGMGGILPKPLDIGTGWYPKAGMQIDEALSAVQARIPWLSKEKLTAAVSLTSEAEKWEGNIALAVKALEIANTPEVMDDGFQAWLRAGGTTEKLLGKPAYAKQMKRLHMAAKQGNQLSEKDFSKVLRLATESADDLFRSTDGRKQKSFYLNLMGDRTIVTVDRHQHDAFFGLATSSDFKILEQDDLDDSVYDLIQDVVFKISDERPDLTPSDVQGVIWEVWRILKDDHLHTANRPWQNGNPFRLFEPDGSENIVFQALTGEYSGGLRDALAAKGSTIPYIIGKSKDGLYSMPDQTAGFVAPVTRESAQKMRHLQPALSERPGVAHWAPSRPRQVTDLEAHVGRLNNELENHVVETWSNGIWANGHPALSPNDVIMVELPVGASPKALGKFGQVEAPAGPGQRSAPKTMDRVTPPDGTRPATVAEFLEARATWEANTPQREFGTSPLPTPVEIKDHKLFLNESGTAGFAISPDGDLQQVFSGGYRGLGGELVEYAITQGARTLDAYDAGLPDYYKRFGFVESGRDAWDPQYDKQGRLDGPDIVYMALDRQAARTTQPTTKVAVKVDPKQAGRLAEIADEIEAAGFRVDVVYSGGPAPRGWATVREHIYQDQVNTSVVRTLDSEIDSYHGVHGWVRKDTAKKLAKKNPDGGRARKPVNVVNKGWGPVVFDDTVALVPLHPKFNGERDGMTALQIIADDFPKFDTDKVHGFQLDKTGPVPALVHAKADGMWGSPAYAVYRNGKVVINVPSEGAPNAAIRAEELKKKVPKDDRTKPVDMAQQVFDLQEASEIKDALLEMGVPAEKIEIRVGDEAITTELVQSAPIKGESVTVHGYHVPALRMSGSPLPQYQQKYGIDVQPGWMSGNRAVAAPPEVFASFEPVLDRFFNEHMEMSRTIGLKRIGFTEDMPAGDDYDPLRTAGWASHGDGGAEIVLNSRVITNPKWFDSDPNYFTVTGSADTVLAHEIGHIMHYAVRKSFRTTTEAADWDKAALKSILKKKQVQADLSVYGSKNIEEMVAEAVAEVFMSPTPRPFALQVYNLVVDQFAANTEVKSTTKKFGWRRNSAA